eukprot:gnl/TRDRNA2_/TRDRNA2_97127_c0_seq3.p1 gnl/TRDRNA2_/TRDRNA2_97127_c0~~gnl/TRDRNA2_/TRDRNA2_97127_c0_seq3.p1  ORF type:complete len:209 (+),score=22.85 gnl/TRDRNA2_/TRDRNA2_97127_c0_seq3:1-627(+)
MSIEGCLGLTDVEIALFASSGCKVTGGVCDGGALVGEVSVSKSGSTLSISSNSIPDHPTCDSSVAFGETCYQQPLPDQFIYAQALKITVPNNPILAASATWVSGGTIGIARNGVSIFSPFSRPCTDAVVDEGIGFDQCRGHPAPHGLPYHYHDAPICLNGYQAAIQSKTPYFIGVMLDGFPIYSKFASDGSELTNAELDECHGYDPGG